ncbi:ATP-binding protein [Maridesulfovibrio hydrothermalis]|uniref:histidine kinase n=1 Tax=Maridesulfovibrio hydrothermalis AM13 = DSM 14728 TaxID=1121451 RepID=L0RGI0_9BACT|nr:ATP-binding protein [Maridesulfovibrio hydrothermalis]CCO25337.1 PAS/PAC sensor signal transduction histidine kinase [Maridesulfovibrio hydrothermalis AM13 = DSM 14728]
MTFSTQKLVDRFSNLTLKNKIFVSTLGVILIISAIIALLARWILVSSLTKELELRGVAIAYSIAERGAGFILDKDYPKLLSLAFEEAKLRERQHLITYIFVLSKDKKVLCHTFTRPFPENLDKANTIPEGEDKSVRLIDLGKTEAYDIAVPIKEGLYRIGTVHVGLNKIHIDQLVSTLRFTFLGFISFVVIIIFVISHRLAQYITKPVSRLTQLSDELSRGNFDFSLDVLSGGTDWTASNCPAYYNTDFPCWHFDLSTNQSENGIEGRKNLQKCQNCHFYYKRDGDEVVQLADSFRNMVWSIKLYRRRLRESEEKYKSLFDSGPDPILVVSCSDFTIIDANPRVTELYGYPRNELIGGKFSKLGPESNEECIKAFEEYGGPSGCIYYPKILHYKKGGNPVYVNMHACPITYKSQPSIIVAINDITEIIEKDAQLVQAAKMKSLGEMSAGVAHEVNQPLNAIKMGSEYLALMAEQGRDLPASQLAEVAREVSTQVDRAAEIISALRAFGRKSGFKTDKVDINEPVRSVLALVTKQFELQKIDFELDLTEKMPRIIAEDNRLQQVFFNLVNNARDAISEKRDTTGIERKDIIRISTYHIADTVCIKVSDTGAGITDEVRNKIFEPFFSTKEIGYGMGLGLAITYGIVRDYKGSIEIESTPGEGASFIIAFPAAKDDN